MTSKCLRKWVFALIAVFGFGAVLATDSTAVAQSDDTTYVAQIGETKYEALDDAIEAAADGDTVTLLAGITLDDDDSIKIHKKTNITLDLNGFHLSGNNNKAGMTLTHAYPSGILNIIDSNVTIQDSSAAKTGTITNNNKGSSSANAIFVRNSKTTTSAQLTIKDGININYPSRKNYPGSSGTPIYAKGANTHVVIYDVNITSGSTAFRLDDDSKFTIYGGTFDAALSVGDISEDRLTVEGGTFIVTTGSMIPNQFTTSRDYVAYELVTGIGESGEEVYIRHRITFPDTQPTDYTARIHLKEGVVSNYSKFYLLDGNLTPFKNFIKEKTDLIDYIEVNKNTQLMGVAFGPTSVDSPPEDRESLKIQIAQGADVEFSSITLGNFDLITAGEGTTSGKIGPAKNYTYRYDETTQTHIGYIPEESKVVHVTYPDGTTEKFVTVQSAFNAANKYEGEEGAVTITLTQDMTENSAVTVKEGKEVILNLGGHTWSNNKYTSTVSPITNKGTLTIENGTFTAPMNVANYAAIRNDGGTLTIAENATVIRTSTKEGEKVSAIINKSGTIINNGTIECNDGCGVVSQGEDSVIEGNGTITTDAYYGVNVLDGTTTVKGGNILGNTSAAQVTKGSLTITGGTFDVMSEDNTALINCDDANYADGTADIIVTGGSFVGFDPENNASEGEGTDFCADEYVSTYGEANDTYVVQKAEKCYTVTIEGLPGGTTVRRTIAHGKTLKLAAPEKDGFTFVGWSGDCVSPEATASVVIMGDATFTANYLPIALYEATTNAVIGTYKDENVFFTRDQIKEMATKNPTIEVKDGIAEVALQLFAATTLKGEDGKPNWAPLTGSENGGDVVEVICDPDTQYLKFVVPATDSMKFFKFAPKSELAE